MNPYESSVRLSERESITITRIYEVNCPTCGVVDATKGRSAADEARRAHRKWHREQAKAAKA